MTLPLPLTALVATAVVVAALLSYLVARLVIARGRRLLDVPGARSSHSEPVPRGGGLGIVAVGLCVPVALWLAGVWSGEPWLLLATMLAVAGIGVLDDFRPRPAALRLAVHLAAGAALAASFLYVPGDADAWLWMAIVALALAWSINLHNFMDGINGLLVLQTVWTGLAYAVLFTLGDEIAIALFALLLASSALGFLPLNWPRARVFLGDGASGFIGLAIGWLALYGAASGAVGLPETLVIASAFLVDSGLTLLVRLLRGRRVWQAHREHLYQQLVLGGRTHGAVSGWYMLWNLAAALPALAALQLRDAAPERWMIALTVLVLATLLWFALRRVCARPMAPEVR